MRTISVKEAASALGLTPRAVTYRIEKGQLKGILTKNEFGVPEWRIYPNKEMMKALNQTEGSQANFSPEEVVDAEPVEAVCDAYDKAEPRSFTTDFQTIVEQCVRPLVEEVKAQTLALAEKDRIIEEQGRQLRLLPDLQKRAEAERKEAELRALEVEALNKQIAAMDEQRQAAEAETERVKSEKETEASAVREQLATLTAKLEKLEQPWWKKWFGPVG